MGSIFASTKNARQILEGSTRFIRSDVPVSVSEDERLWLIENNVREIVDLRTDEEREKKPCPLAFDERFNYHKAPISGGSSIPKSPDHVSKSYIGMVDEALEKTIDFMLSSRSGVLYFCNAGKDRTGVVSAILLRSLGKSREYVVEDYMRSKDNLAEMLKSFAAQNPQVDINVIIPCERCICEFLDWYEKR